MTSEASSTQTSGARTVSELARAAGAAYGERLAARFKRDGEWRQVSFAAFATQVQDLALGLVELGIEAGDRVCILADTRP